MKNYFKQEGLNMAGNTAVQLTNEEHLVSIKHATNYQLDSLEELLEYMWLRPNETNLNVDIFVDDGGSYLRHEHELLLFVRNGYDTSVQEFIPISVSQTPMILNENIERNISAKDITEVLHFIVKNQEALQALADREISQIEFIPKF